MALLMNKRFIMQARNGSMSNRPEMEMKRVLNGEQDTLEPDDLRCKRVLATKLLQASGQILGPWAVEEAPLNRDGTLQARARGSIARRVALGDAGAGTATVSRRRIPGRRDEVTPVHPMHLFALNANSPNEC